MGYQRTCWLTVSVGRCVEEEEAVWLKMENPCATLVWIFVSNVVLRGGPEKGVDGGVGRSNHKEELTARFSINRKCTGTLSKLLFPPNNSTRFTTKNEQGGWQDAFGCFSVSRSSIAIIVIYFMSPRPLQIPRQSLKCCSCRRCYGNWWWGEEEVEVKERMRVEPPCRHYYVAILGHGSYTCWYWTGA